jgi:hypothetical protein
MAVSVPSDRDTPRWNRRGEAHDRYAGVVRRDREKRHEGDAEPGGDKARSVPLLSERKANSSE